MDFSPTAGHAKELKIMSIIESTRAEIMRAIKPTYTETEYGCTTSFKQNIANGKGAMLMTRICSYSTT